MKSVTRASLAVIALSLVIVSCQKKIKGDEVTPPGAPSPVEFRFENKVDVKNLVLDSTYVTGPLLQTFKVSDFKYYISNIQFVNSGTGDTVKVADTYFLVDERKADSKKFSFTIPAGEYFACSFLVGVDSARSASGAQTGALDPALGMFWNRNDGYIMLKLEGTSPSSPLPGNVITYHIGGYKGQYNVISARHFKVGLASVQPNRKTVLTFTADARALFSNPNAISISTTPSVTAPGDVAKKIGDNLNKVISFLSLRYE